jgi:hypothetical protein
MQGSALRAILVAMQQPTTQTLYDLFNGRTQFVVPVYQRAYVWNEEDNWSVLWDDIADTAERYIANPTEGRAHRHFLGPIVLEQQHFEPGGVDLRLVIDGQQRLTTLQVLLAAASAVAENRGMEEAAKEIRGLTFNSGRAAAGDMRYKVRPSRRDRAAFVSVMDSSDDSPRHELVEAHRFFRERIESWLDEPDVGHSQQDRLEMLRVCLDGLLYVVSINLDSEDNAQVIFETLNARGTGLGALDLVKNATFLHAEREGSQTESLYDRYWEPTFEADDYWTQESRQGRQKRDRADWFLMHWLGMTLGGVVRVDKLFDTFRRHLLRDDSAPRMDELIPTLCADAGIVRSFDNFGYGTPEGLFFSRLDAMDTTTLLPIALLLFRSQELTLERRRRALAALESWLVRRGILRLTTRNYNRTLSDLVKAVKSDLAHADEAIVEELKSSDAATAVWPKDGAVRERMEQQDTYGYLTQARVRMLLEACELDVRDPAKTEAIELPSGLSIEHAMPVSWEENWSLPGASESQIERRNAHIHRIGNLTLVTQSLNSSLSNAPWQANSPKEHSKRVELAKRSLLLINQHLCQNETWDEDLLDQRGKDFTNRILRTWPGPESSFWDQNGAT